MNFLSSKLQHKKEFTLDPKPNIQNNFDSEEFDVYFTIISNIRSYKLEFEDVVANEFGGSKNAYALAEGTNAESIANRRKNMLPSFESIEKMLKSNKISDLSKFKILSSFTSDWWQLEKKHSAEGRGGVKKISNLLKIDSYPQIMKEHWQEKLSHYNLSNPIPPEKLIKKRSEFIPTLKKYIAETNSLEDSKYKPCLTGFISYLKTEWNIPNLNKLCVILNSNPGTVSNLLLAGEEKPPREVMTNRSTLDQIINSKYLSINEREAKFFVKFATGNLDMPSEKNILIIAKCNLSQASSVNEKKDISQQLFLDLVNIRGYKAIDLYSNNNLSADQTRQYTDGTRFFGGINSKNPEVAFKIAKVFFPDDDKQRLNLASNFLSLPEYKSGTQLKKEFLINKTSLNDVFLTARLLSARKNIGQLSSSLYAIKNYTPLSKFEKKETNKIPHKCLGLFSQKYLNVKTKDEMLEIFSKSRESGINVIANRLGKYDYSLLEYPKTTITLNKNITKPSLLESDNFSNILNCEKSYLER